MQNNKIGSGLHNLGNTCFFNAVMQVILYTPSLAQYLREKRHSQICKNQNCLWHDSKKSRVVSPNQIVSNLRFIFKKFRLGRQQDSHQFLRYLVEGMQDSETGKLGKDRQKNQSLIMKTTTYHTFGGKIRTFVLCLNCHHKSLTTQRYYDLSIECQKSNNLQEGLQNFFKVDDLTGANKYKCDSCKQLSNAKKGFKIISIPSVVTFQFKRFTNSLRKIGKLIEYPKTINLARYMQQNQHSAHDSKLELYGVIVHSGSSAGSGHYYAFVKNGSDWFEMNDSNVSRCNEERVLRQQAYLLFYRKVYEERPLQTEQIMVQKNQIMTNIKNSNSHQVKLVVQSQKKQNMIKMGKKQPQTLQKIQKKKANDIKQRKKSQQQIEQTKRKLSFDIQKLKQQAREEQKAAEKEKLQQQNIKNKKLKLLNGHGPNFSQLVKKIPNGIQKQKNPQKIMNGLQGQKQQNNHKKIDQEDRKSQQNQDDSDFSVPKKLERRKSKQQALSQLNMMQLILAYADKISNLSHKISRPNHRAMKSVYNLRKFQIASKRRKLG